MFRQFSTLFPGNATANECVIDLDKFNLVKFGYGGLVLG